MGDNSTWTNGSHRSGQAFKDMLIPFRLNNCMFETDTLVDLQQGDNRSTQPKVSFYVTVKETQSNHRWETVVFFKLTEVLLAVVLQLAALFLFQFFVLMPCAARSCCTATKRMTFLSITFISQFCLVLFKLTVQHSGFSLFSHDRGEPYQRPVTTCASLHFTLYHFLQTPDAQLIVWVLIAHRTHKL